MFHFLSIRANDVNNAWSVVAVRSFYKEIISTSYIPNMVAMEYFIDTDPGYGLATNAAVTAGSPLTQNFTEALQNTVSDGFHFLSIRVKDANYKWSVVAVRPFFKEVLPSNTIPNITQMEYFIDADSGYGNGTAMSFTAGSPITLNFTTTHSSLAVGNHKISIRAKDANNKWSIVGVKDFVVSNTFTLVGSSRLCDGYAFVVVQSGFQRQKVYLNLKITHIEINERKIVISFTAVKDRNTHVRRYNLRTAGVVL